jgi:hypothetical protein
MLSLINIKRETSVCEAPKSGLPRNASLRSAFLAMTVVSGWIEYRDWRKCRGALVGARHASPAAAEGGVYSPLRTGKTPTAWRFRARKGFSPHELPKTKVLTKETLDEVVCFQCDQLSPE